MPAAAPRTAAAGPATGAQSPDAARPSRGHAELAAAAAAAAGQTDLNTADAAALEAVNGIGEKLAGVIVRERQARPGGRFHTWDELAAAVKGLVRSVTTRTRDAPGAVLGTCDTAEHASELCAAG
eukprot:366451-Chlamydomonas_euryale.AAC.3